MTLIRLSGDLNTLLLLGKPQQREGSGVFLAGMQGAQGILCRPPWGRGSGLCVAPRPALQVWSGGSDPSVVLQLSLSSLVRFLPPELGSLHLPRGLTAPPPALAPAWAQLCRDGPHPERCPLSLPPRRGVADSLTAQHTAPSSRTLGAGSGGAASGAPVKVSPWWGSPFPPWGLAVPPLPQPQSLRSDFTS